MRRSLAGEYNPPVTNMTTTTSNDAFSTTGNFGHPLDMLARTAANTTSPPERFSGMQQMEGHMGMGTLRQPLRLGPADAIPTTWTSDLSGIDPVERGWLDIDDAKALFER